MGRWTEPEAVVTALRRRWTSGALLRIHAGAEPWEPVSVPIKAPRASEITGALDEVRAWVRSWDDAEARRPFRLETRTVGGRLVGHNSLPTRAHVETLADAWTLLGVRRDVAAFDALLEHTPGGAMRDWVVGHPLRALSHAAAWPAILATVGWIEARSGEGLYLRQVDVEGADTKFIERHRGILAALLDQVLPAERVTASAPVSAFARRYGFAGKPEYVRWRHLDPVHEGFSELTVRADELATTPPRVSRVIAVENEISYLALPPCTDAIGVFASGYGLTRFAQQAWLSDVDVHYWGDIDTHGFAILDEFRTHVPHTRSMLMDRATLLAHRAHWSSEPSPGRAQLHHLDSAERETYDDLRDDTHGPAVRLEQERIRFSHVEGALASVGLGIG